MTLDEAIIHCEEKACGTTGCAMEHKQLCEWLKELRRLTGGKDVITVGKESVMAAMETGDDNTKAVLRKLFGMEGCEEGKPPVSGQAGCVRDESARLLYKTGDRVLIRYGEGYKTSLHRETAYGGETVVAERPTVYSVKDVIVSPVPGESVCVLEYAGPDNCLFPVLRERMQERYLEREASL